MKTIRDNTWIWGHPPGSVSGPFQLPPSQMTPMEAAAYFGARNSFYLPMFADVDMTKCNLGMYSLDHVGWALECVYSHPEVIDRLFSQAERFPNISCGIFDDFFNEENAKNNSLNYTPEFLASLRTKLHTGGVRPLEMWLVFYTKQFGKDYSHFIREFDGVSLWFWSEYELENYEQFCRRFFEMTPTNKRMIGVYLYNFGEKKEADLNLVKYQLDCCSSWMKDGTIDGVILHTNAVADLGLEAVEAVKQWYDLHGDETVPGKAPAVLPRSSQIKKRSPI